jgi:large subunit ribosomal protein L9
MQVILLEKIVNLGGLGDVVKVRNGFARNYLIPQGKARRATEAAIKEFETRRSDLEKLSGLVVKIAMKAGVDGRLFGSVTNFDISEALCKQGFEVSKGQVRMPQGPLKAVGEHHVAVVLYSDVAADITIAVAGEQA